MCCLVWISKAEGGVISPHDVMKGKSLNHLFELTSSKKWSKPAREMTWATGTQITVKKHFDRECFTVWDLQMCSWSLSYSFHSCLFHMHVAVPCSRLWVLFLQTSQLLSLCSECTQDALCSLIGGWGWLRILLVLFSAWRDAASWDWCQEHQQGLKSEIHLSAVWSLNFTYIALFTSLVVSACFTIHHLLSDFTSLWYDIYTM